MKFLALSLAVLALLAGGLLAFVNYSKSTKLAGQLGEMEQTIANMAPGSRASLEKELGGEIPSAGRLRVGAYTSLVGVVAALLVLIFTFTKNRAQRPILLATLAICLLAVLLYPSLPTSETGGMAPRSLAIWTLGMAALQAGCLWYVASARRRA